MNVALTPMNAGAFLAWLEQQPSWRFELVNGQIIAMNPQHIEHIETKVSMVRALQDALRGSSCRAIGDGMCVQVDDATVYEPDALVYCGERLPMGTTHMTSPVVVVEILSSETKTVETTRKLEGYFKLQSVRHYLIVDPALRTIVHHARDSSGAIATEVLSGGELMLDAIDARLPVLAMFPD